MENRVQPRETAARPGADTRKGDAAAPPRRPQGQERKSFSAKLARSRPFVAAPTD